MSKGSIIIVEDEEVLRDAYELILDSAGYKVYAVGNGKEALELLKKVSPDVMLLDMFMPVMNGREVLRKPKRSDHPQMKIIVCSNMSDNALREEVLKNGADLFVLKSSVGPKELTQLIDEVTGQKR
jgi:CheY-like chemotaxis protein